MSYPTPRHLSWTALALSAAAFLSACGGADTAPTTQRVHVMGDSLADVGTFFGIKATIQGNDMYPELVAKAYGLAKGCNVYAYTGTTFGPNSTAGCTNYAIGGGVINRHSAGLVSGDPRTISVQFTASATATRYGEGDLVVIDGGGNDAAGLVGAYLNASTDGGTAYRALLGTVLSAEQVAAAVAGGTETLDAVGSTYMAALADIFYGQIKSGVLDQGAQRVAVLNMPDITRTPRFQAVLDGISYAYANMPVGIAARVKAEQLFKSWVLAFNTQLATRVASDSRLALVDFHAALNAQMTDPAKYGLTNVTTPACPVTGTDDDGLPAYNFATCTDAALAANPPEGASGSTWYTRYAFSDGFHPTPYGHQLLADEIFKRLRQVNWLD